MSQWSAKDDSRSNKHPLQGHRGTSDCTRWRNRLLCNNLWCIAGQYSCPLSLYCSLDYASREATKDTSTGFTLEKKQDSTKPALYITDTDFADNLALISNYMEQAQLLLSRLEMAAESIGLHANCKKMEYMLYSQDERDLKTLSGDLLKQVHDFKYVSSWIAEQKRHGNSNWAGMEGAKQVRQDLEQVRITNGEFYGKLSKITAVFKARTLRSDLLGICGGRNSWYVNC